MKLSNGMTVIRMGPLGETPEQKANILSWVSALRSGKYSQTKGCYQDNTGSFCILGLGCEVYRQNTGDGEWIENRWETRNFFSQGSDPCTGLPGSVRKYFDDSIRDFNVKVVYAETDEYDFEWLPLHRLNDRYNVTFEDFANILEAAANGGYSLQL